MSGIAKIGFGGGCHWCTEAVFQSLKGVELVEQGWIASTAPNTSFSEAIIIHFNPDIISLKALIEIHLHTHKSTSLHTMRKKYRSAIYYFSKNQKQAASAYIISLQKNFSEKIITEILPYASFKSSLEMHQNYYYQNPEKPFCKNYIDPKLRLLLEKFSSHVDHKKVNI